MSGHIQAVKVCSTCAEPVHVDVCNIPEIVTCEVATGATTKNSSITSIVGTQWVVEESGVPTKILYTFGAAATADTFESLIAAAVAWASEPDTVATIAYSGTGTALPLPPIWNANGVTYERVAPTQVRVTWNPVAMVEDWATTVIPYSSMQGWFSSLSTFRDEGVVNTWPASAPFRVAAFGPTYVSVQTLPVSLPCGVEVNNADELADAIARGVASGAQAAAAPDNELQVLCDLATTPPTPYLRRAIVDPVTAAVTWTNVNITTGATYAPTTPGVCDGYQVVVDETCVLDLATGLNTSAKITQVYRYGTAIGVPVITNSATGAVITITGTLQQYDCSIIATELIPFCRTDTGAVVLRKVVSVAGSEVFSEWIDPITNATIAAPPAAVLTQDCDVQTDFETVCASIGGAQVAVEVRRTFRDGTLLSTVYTRLDTNTVIGAPVIVPCQPTTSARTVLRCGATSNTTTTASVQATRVALENDVILTKACPTTSALTNNVVAAAVNAAVNGTGGRPDKRQRRDGVQLDQGADQLHYLVARHGGDPARRYVVREPAGQRASVLGDVDGFDVSR